jgi:hypothetical protein
LWRRKTSYCWPKTYEESPADISGDELGTFGEEPDGDGKPPTAGQKLTEESPADIAGNELGTFRD